MKADLTKAQPWKPADATDNIRSIAHGEFRLHLTDHAREQMSIRDLFTGDIRHVLKHGFVYEEAIESTRPGYFKYKMDGLTPNSDARPVRVIVVVGCQPPSLKIVTVMWKQNS